MTPADPAESTHHDLSRHPAIDTIAFDDASAAQIAATLGVDLGTASFRLPSSTVYQVTVPGTNERPAALVTLWPGIQRVDVVAGPATVVFTKIAVVDLVPDVEVQFRRATREYLIVARGGKVIVRA